MLDSYSLRARMAPAALAALPALALAGGTLSTLDHLGSILTFALSALAVVLCGWVRNAGLQLEPALWEAWGGAPTTHRMRWRENEEMDLGIRHQRLTQITGREMPSETEEESEPAAADDRYIAAVADLRDLTRDTEKYSLVAHENAEYGFRRNCLGLRPYAMSIAVGVLIASLILAGSHDWSPRYVLPGGLAAIALLGWWRLVTQDWVRQAGEHYATRLFEALARLTRAGS